MRFLFLWRCGGEPGGCGCVETLKMSCARKKKNSPNRRLQILYRAWGMGGGGYGVEKLKKRGKSVGSMSACTHRSWFLCKGLIVDASGATQVASDRQTLSEEEDVLEHERRSSFVVRYRVEAGRVLPVDVSA